MIGRLESVVLDCRDPHALARFYSELLGWPVVRVDGDWVEIGDGRSPRLSFQLAPDHRPAEQLGVEVRQRVRVAAIEHHRFQPAYHRHSFQPCQLGRVAFQLRRVVLEHKQRGVDQIEPRGLPDEVRHVYRGCPVRPELMS